MKTETVSEITITNRCTCVTYNDDLGEWETAPECWGDCWEDQVYDFEQCTETLRDNNETGWWKITGLQLWDHAASGYFHATKVVDILRGMTVNSEWTLRGKVFDNRIEYSLSHHDAPMGSSTKLLPVTEEEREDSGLY